jgi:hypothetical protein
MATKIKVSEWDSEADNNILINGININENCPPSAINNAIREMMAQIKDWQSGSSGDDWTSSGVLNVTGTLKLDGDLGTNGQVLSSQGTTATPIWKTLGTMSNQNSSSVTTGDLNITGAFKLDGSVGSAGQVMVSTGSSATPTWGNAFIRGMIMLWTGSTAPSGWALCNGSNGTPDLRDKFVMGSGGSQATSGGYADATLPSHTHTGTTNNGGAKTISSPVTLSGSTSSAGASTLKPSVSVSGTTNTTGAHTHGSVINNTTKGPGNGVKSFSSQYYGEWIMNSPNTASAGNHNHSVTSTGTVTVSIPNHTHSISGSGTATVTIPNHTHTFTTDNAGGTNTNRNLPPYYALAYIMKL